LKFFGVIGMRAITNAASHRAGSPASRSSSGWPSRQACRISCTVIQAGIDVDRSLVAAMQAGDVEAAHAVLAYVPKVIVRIDQVQTLPHHVGGLEGTGA
jgi:hypothetical protein